MNTKDNDKPEGYAYSGKVTVNPDVIEMVKIGDNTFKVKLKENNFTVTSATVEPIESGKKCVFGTFPSYTDTTDKTKLLPMDGVEIYES